MTHQYTTFTKPPFTLDAQLERLIERGVIINDKTYARHCLTYISYYRFCGYAIELEAETANGEKQYRNGTTFEHILNNYQFDRKLRMLITDAIERIEIAIRTVITNELSLKFGSHWYLNKTIFLPSYPHDQLIKSIEKETQYGVAHNTKRERFIQHYFDKYQSPDLPPAWMIAEVLSLGTWSRIFANLNDRQDQKIICKHFELSYKVMTSWLHALTYIRNLCAHHCKLWSRTFTLKPITASKYQNQLEKNAYLSGQVAMLKIFLNVISPGNELLKRLSLLIKEYPEIDVRRMGFNLNWENDPLWDEKPKNWHYTFFR